MPKKSILIWGDSPTVHTGLGRVTKNICNILHSAGFNLEVVGINLFEPNEESTSYPYRIFSCGDSEFGEGIVKQKLIDNDYDILITLGNVYLTTRLSKFMSKLKGTKWIAYVPTEADKVTKAFIKGLDIPDKLITYTERGAKLLSKELDREVGHIPLGGGHFYPLPKSYRNELKKKYFGCDPDTFLVMNINRHQWRKNLFASMLGFMFFDFMNPYAKKKLYLHTERRVNNSSIGVQLESAMMLMKEYYNFDFDSTKIIITPEKFSHEKISEEKINEIYNAVDLVMLTSYAEGWGYSASEAMACKTPVLAPRHTSLVDVLGDGEYGWFIDTLETKNPLNSYVLQYGNCNLPYKQLDIDSIYSKLSTIYGGKRDVQKKVEAAFVASRQRAWLEPSICDAWINLIKKI